MDFAHPKPAGSELPIPFHFYYHPTAHDPTAYPYGKDRGGGQPHVGLGYRHLLFETWGGVQHYYAGRRVVYVVPVGSPAHQFGEASGSLGIWTLLSELNLALHQVNGATFADYQNQEVGRVAISGFSAGASAMLAALSNRSSALGQSFVDNRVRELYCWDGAIGGPGIKNTVPQDFGSFARAWWKDPQQRIRVYTQNAQYDTALGFLSKLARPAVAGPAGSLSKTWAKDGQEFATLVRLPDGFFRRQYAPHEDPVSTYQGGPSASADPGFPSYIDTHHWFSTVFMQHALARSGFPAF